jgi:hypothetical protein
MFYTPKHCCECGEKIEASGRKLFKSPRFCEICETDFIAYDWAPRVIIGLALVFGIFGIGSLLKKSDKPLNIATTPQVSVTSNRNQSVQNSQVSANANVLTVAQSQPANSIARSTASTEAIVLNQKHQQAKQNLTDGSQNSALETVYFCGAQTKKGTPCSRRVKGGGRCWQHTGQPAMLPAEKLVASR